MSEAARYLLTLISAGAILLFFVWSGIRGKMTREWGWRLIVIGLLLFLFATLVDLLDNFTLFTHTSLNTGRSVKEVLIHGASLVLGFIALVVGFSLWLRRVVASARDRVVLKMVVDALGGGVIVADGEGKIVEWYGTAEQIIGDGPAEAEQTKWPAHYGVFKSDKVTLVPHQELPLVRALDGESVDDYEIFVRSPSVPNGVWIGCNSRPIYDSSGSIDGGVSILRDTTRSRQAEAESRIREAELESVNRELRAFSYSVSHDLRAPLRAVSGFSQALQEDYGEKLGDEGQDYLGRVIAASRKMEQLINSMLALSRVSSTELVYQRLDISELAMEVFKEMAEHDPGRKVEIVVPEDIQARGDKALVLSVLDNLIGNAWKYTSTTANARIELGVETMAGEKVYFVKDNGIGFDPKLSDRLFMAFQRLHHEDGFRGTGVGLATVQRIVHRHGGRIWAEGKVGAGATIYFTL